MCLTGENDEEGLWLETSDTDTSYTPSPRPDIVLCLTTENDVVIETCGTDTSYTSDRLGLKGEAITDFISYARQFPW